MFDIQNKEKEIKIWPILKVILQLVLIPLYVGTERDLNYLCRKSEVVIHSVVKVLK